MGETTISPEQLGDAIAEELTIYCESVTEGVDKSGRRALKKLVGLTRGTAPVGNRGSFARNIAGKEFKQANGNRFVWYVKPPDHRLTHLLVHGHANRDGSRTAGNPFLQNALDQVLPEYEAAVKDVIERG